MRFESKQGEDLHPQVDEGTEIPWKVEVVQNERLQNKLVSIYRLEGGHRQGDLDMRSTRESEQERERRESKKYVHTDIPCLFVSNPV